MRQPLLKQQPILRLSGTQGTEQTHTVPSTLTKIILVLLTMLLLPNAAWGQTTVTVTKTITFNQSVTSGSNINNSTIPVTVNEVFKVEGESDKEYTYNSYVGIWNGDNVVDKYYSSNDGAIIFEIDEYADIDNYFSITLPGNYPATPDKIELTVAYSNAGSEGGFAKIMVIDTEEEEKIYIGTTASLSEKTLTFVKDGIKGDGVDGQTNRDYPGAENITVYMNGASSITPTFTIKQVVITYNISESEVYGLTVAGIPVTSVNASAVLFDPDNWVSTNPNGTAKVSFTSAEGSTPATLTLNGAGIEYDKGNVIVSTLTTPLAVKLSGNSNISSGSNLPFEGATGDNANLVFKCEDSGSLVMSSTHAGFSTTSFYTGFNKVLYPEDEGNLYAYLSEDNVVIEPITSYGLTVAGVEVTSANLNTETGAISGLNNVFFSPAPVTQSTAPATLTLNGATINGKIRWRSSDNLTIALNGMNTIVSEEGGELFISEQSCTLFIAKADNAESATLKYASYSGSGNEITNASDFFSNFGPITPSSVFNQSPFTVQVDGINYNYYTTAEVYPVTVAGRQVHNISGEPGNKDDILGDGKVKFNGSSSTLTLDNAKISVTTLEGNGIETSLEEALTIDLKGTNSITSNGYSFYGTGTSTINITSTYTPAGTLTLNSNTGLAKLVTVSSDVYNLESISWESGKNALIAKGFTGLTIAGTPITSDNIGTNGVISGVSGITSGTVSFAEAQSDPETPATLTLDNASITGDIKFNASLTVHLVGDNTITNPEDPNSFYAFNLGNTYNYLKFSTDETKPGTLKFVGLDSTLPDNGIIYSGQIEGGSATIGTTGDAVIWKQTFSTTGVTPSYFILSLNKHYNLWKNGHQYHDLILDNNDGYVFNPEESTLTINSSSPDDYINSGLEDLTIIVSGSQSLSYIAFGAPAGIQAEGITTGTLTITGKKDSESSSSSNSLSLSNSGGVITGFSPVSLTLPMHVSETTPSEFTGWTSNVTYAYITDETGDYIFDEALTDGINYVTYYSLDRDLFLSNALTPSVITEISGSTVKTQALSYIPKKTPVLVTKATNTATTATFTKNMLKFAESGNPETASADKVLYVLYNNQFVKVTPGSSVEYGGYLNLTGVNLPSSTRSLTIDGDDEGTTALREVRSEGVKGEKWDDGEWYTLQGRKFTTKPTKPGLYILNGKKVVIK